ncbi:HAD family hydrolase, partial [Candidatus Woesearchaeota archaeon]|nr:HAD family hydrolase [Candidatus Woesearchaeota archaeon]
IRQCPQGLDEKRCVRLLGIIRGRWSPLFHWLSVLYHMAVKVVGFDLDGTLAGEEFDKLVWNEEIPKLSAAKHNIPLEEAKTRVYADYFKAKYVENVPEWTNIEFWFARLGLEQSWNKLLQDMKGKIYLFPESVQVLKKCAKYKRVIISNSHPHFLNLKIKIEGLSTFFDEIISTPTFHHKKKSKHLFKDLCDHFGIKPSEMAFVGNDEEDDYDNPRSVGIHAFFLDRSGKQKGEHVVHSLTEFLDKLRDL